MKIKSLHEIYISYKLFETIGFHNQGIYDISAQVVAKNQKQNIFAHPLMLKSKKPSPMLDSLRMSTLNHTGMTDTNTSAYHTTTFQVSFNQQTFPFSGSCLFKLEIDAEVQKLYQLSLILKLNRYGANSGDKNGGITGVTDRSECAIKETQEVSTKRTSHVGLRTDKQVVSQSKIIINLDSKVENDINCCYRKVVFTTFQYFSSLLLTVNHCKIGYRIRPNPYTMSQFANISPPHSPEYRRKDNISLQPPKIQQPQIVALLKKCSTNSKNLYEKLVSEPILQLKKLQQFQRHLKKTHGRSLAQNSVNESNERRPLSFQSIQKSSQQLQYSTINKRQICVSQPLTFEDQTDYINILLTFYESENEEQLFVTLLKQNMQICKGIRHIWNNCMILYNGQEYSSKYLHRMYLGFREQVRYLRENRFAQSLQDSRVYKQFIPQLKFLNQKYLRIPYFFKTQTIQSRLKTQMYEDEVDDVKPQNTLFILVHGFNGNQYDMNRIKSFIGLFDSPHFLILRNISTKTMDTLQELGSTAAQQIINYVANRHYIRKINFIGFSLGGLIIRAALPHLRQYHQLFHLMITLSSPHLGVNELKSCIVRTGISFLHKVRGVKNLRQMTIDIQISKESEMKNKEDLTFLQKLCQDNSISNFKIVVFLGSDDDKYVPGYSSILQYQGNNPKIHEMQKEMEAKIMNLHRIHVNFDPKNRGSNWERFLGRRVHINFLDDQAFLFFLFSQYFPSF